MFIFGANLTSLGDNAFSSCKALDGEVNLQYVTSIGDNTFISCTRISNLTFSYNLTTISGWAFAGCTYLKSDIEVPSNVKKVGNCVFRASGITSLIFLGNSTEITPGYWSTPYGIGYRTLR